MGWQIVVVIVGVSTIVSIDILTYKYWKKIYNVFIKDKKNERR